MDDKKVISLLKDYELQLRYRRKAAIEPYTVQKLDEDLAEVEEAIEYMKCERFPRIRIVGNPVLCLHNRPD